jgi:hypothetical protein
MVGLAAIVADAELLDGEVNPAVVRIEKKGLL